MHTNTTTNIDYKILKKMAFKERSPKHVNIAMMNFIDSPNEKYWFTFNDIHNFYVDHWHSFSMDEKMKKSKYFKQIHNWVKRVGYKYNLNQYDTVGTTVDKMCYVCRGTGLFVRHKKYYHLVTCPDCNGTARNGKSFCKTCAIMSPFGLAAGSGKVLIESKIPTKTFICQKCSGMGVK